jgi:hypothetical protein
VIDIMRTHPMIVIGGILQQNPFFQPPRAFLRELRERRATQTTSPRTAAWNGNRTRTSRRGDQAPAARHQ